MTSSTDVRVGQVRSNGRRAKSLRKTITVLEHADNDRWLVLRDSGKKSPILGHSIRRRYAVVVSEPGRVEVEAGQRSDSGASVAE